MIETKGAALGALVMDGRHFTTREWTAAGGHTKDLRYLVATGQVRSPLYGVYVDVRVVETIETRLDALKLVMPDGAAVARLTAAWAYGIDARSPDEARRPVPLQVVVPNDRQPLHRRGVKCYASDLTARDLVEVGGLTFTTPLRTTADLLRWSVPGVGLGAADMFAHAGLVERDELVAELARWRARYGIAKARELALLVDPRCESPGESVMRLRLVQAGLRGFELQVEVVRGSRVRRIDLGWREARVGVEYYGEEFHTEAEHVAADAERVRWLVEDMGWRIVVVTKSDVWGWDLAFESRVGGLLGLGLEIENRLW